MSISATLESASFYASKFFTVIVFGHVVSIYLIVNTNNNLFGTMYAYDQAAK